MSSKLKNNKGSALLITIVLLFMLAGFAIMSVDRSTTDMELSYNQVHDEQSFYIAETGAKKALASINLDNAWRSGYYNEPYSNGSFTVTVTDSMVDSTLADTIMVVSDGLLSEASSTVELTVVPIYHYPFRYGLFGEAGITFARGTCTDSYAADSGSYWDTQLDSLGDIGSNGTIGSDQQVNFGGGIAVATPGGINLGAGNTVNGDTTSSADSVDLNIIPPEEYEWARSVNNADNGGITGTDYTYDRRRNTLTTGSNSNIELAGGVYYFSDSVLGQYSNITIAPGASVTIYVTGGIDLGQGSTMNNGGTPSNMVIYSCGTYLTFHQNNIFYGAFYGPYTDIQYDQTTQVYGSLVGHSVNLDRDACFHYDRSLSRIRKGTTGEYVAVAWRELQ